MTCCACQSDPLVPIQLDYFQGDTAPIELTATTQAGTPYDLTGCAAEWLVRPSAGCAPVWHSTTGGSGITIIDAAGGRLLIVPTTAQSAALHPGRTYETILVLRDADGSILTTATGYLAVHSSIVSLSI